MSEDNNPIITEETAEGIYALTPPDKDPGNAPLHAVACIYHPAPGGNPNHWTEFWAYADGAYVEPSKTHPVETYKFVKIENPSIPTDSATNFGTWFQANYPMFQHKAVLCDTHVVSRATVPAPTPA